MLLDTVGIRMLSPASVRGESWYLTLSVRLTGSGRGGEQRGGGDCARVLWSISLGDTRGEVDDEEEGPANSVGGVILLAGGNAGGCSFSPDRSMVLLNCW